MAFKVVLALAVVALAAAQEGYDYNTPGRTFSHFGPVRAVHESSEEDDGYDYQQPARTFTHRAPVRIARPKNAYVAPPKPVVTYVAPVTESSEEDDGYKYQQPARTFTHRAPVRIVAPARPKNTYVAPVKPVARYVAPVIDSSEEDGYDYQQPARTFTHRAPVRVARPKNTYVAPTTPVKTYVAPTKPVKTYVAPVKTYVAPVKTYVAPVKTYVAPANTYKAPGSDEVLDYVPTKPEYNQRYDVSDDETGAAFHHEEERDGAQTSGSYSVNLPDGRVQTVTYYVNGDGGFVADVSYEGTAEYPPEPKGGYGAWTGPIAQPGVVRDKYGAPSAPRRTDEYGAPSAPRRTVVAVDSSEEVQRPRGLYNTPRP